MKLYLDSCKLTEDEKKKIEQLISLIPNFQNFPETQQLIFNILTARKFSVPNSLELYHNYKNDHDIAGVRVAQFFIRLHRKTDNHRALLRSIIFQLDAAMKKETASRNGLVFIYDMTNSKYSNFDYTFSCKLFKMLRLSYPVRLRRVIILAAPVWFRASFAVMRVIIRELFQDCVYFIRPSPGTKLEALSHPDPVVLKRDYYAWLQTAIIRMDSFRSEMEQVSPMPNGQRTQTISAFFGTSLDSNVSGSVSDSSDSEFRDDDVSSNCGSGTGLMDDDDFVSVGDLDPFSMASSYSGDADNSDAESTSDILMKGLSSSKLDMDISLNFNCDELCTRKQNSESLNNSDHAGTPTPPTMAKRQQLMSDVMKTTSSPVSLPTTTVSNIHKPDTISTYCTHPPSATRPSTVNTISINSDKGFGEGLYLPISMESTTPTVDQIANPLLGSEVDEVKHHVTTTYRHSAGPNSSCSSTTSFFSTGSTGLFSARCVHSPNCSPTMEKLNQNLTFHHSNSSTYSNSNRISTAENGSDLKSVSNYDLVCRDLGHNERGDNRTAPLAQDEIGGITSKPFFNPGFCTNYLPPWAMGRLQGRSIHENSDSILIDSLELDNPSIKPSKLVKDDTVKNGVQSNLNPIRLLDVEKQKLFDEIDANMIEISGHNTSDEEDIYDDDDDDDDDDEEEEEEEEEEGEGESENNEEDVATIDMKQHWRNPNELLDHIQNVGFSGLNTEYAAIVKIKYKCTRSAFKHVLNSNKNRYCDVVCNDASRVRLRPLSNINPTDTPLPLANESPLNHSNSNRKSTSSQLHRTQSAPLNSISPIVRNYIHANWVDGYRQKNAFICTQGPLAETVGDFWQMIWDYRSPVVVMITKIYEADRPKCYHYWPELSEQKLYFTSGQTEILPQKPLVTNLSDQLSNSGGTGGSKEKCLKNTDTEELDKSNHVSPDFEVQNMKSETTSNFVKSYLRLKYLPTGECRNVEHFAFFSWPDHGTPETTTGLLDLLNSVQMDYLKSIKRDLGYDACLDQEIPPPPIVVHCSAGIGRTGTYVTVDICTKWLSDLQNMDQKINIPLTVSRVRSQRYGCVQVLAQYLFCYRAIVDYAVQNGLLDGDRANTIVNTLVTESNVSLSTVDNHAMYYQSTSLPFEPFEAMNPALMHLFQQPIPHQLHQSSSAQISSHAARSPFHDLLSLFTSANLASLKNSIRSRTKPKEEFPEPNFTVLSDRVSSGSSSSSSSTSMDHKQQQHHHPIVNPNSIPNADTIRPIDIEVDKYSTDSNTLDVNLCSTKSNRKVASISLSSSSSSSSSSASSLSMNINHDHPAMSSIQAPFSRPPKPVIADKNVSTHTFTSSSSSSSSTNLIDSLFINSTVPIQTKNTNDAS